MSKAKPMSLPERKERLKREGGQEDEEENQDGKENKQNPDLLTIEDENAGEILRSVSSETARDILRSIHGSPKMPIDLAEEHGTTTQNVRYHLGKLEQAGLVEVGDIRYSEKGREMYVYEPSNSPSVLLIGQNNRQSADT
jgi:DNA-binding transcriptional ArsR family regulator